MQVYCEFCKSRFFPDEESDILEGKYVCSWCMPKIRKCLVCKKTVMMRYKVDNLYGICPDCRKEYGSLMGYTNIYLILRFITFQKDNFTCRYCGRSPLKDKDVELHCDHIMPRSHGGEDTLNNLVTSCKECNEGKVDCLLTKSQELEIQRRKIFNADENN